MRTLFALVLSALFLWSACGEKPVKGLRLEGQVNGAATMQVYFEKTLFDRTTTSIATAVADGEGKFLIELPEKPEAGIYRLRIGQQAAVMVLDGSEGKLSLAAESLPDMGNYVYTLGGAPATASVLGFYAFARQQGGLNMGDVSAFVDSTGNALTAALVGMTSLGEVADSAALAIHRRVNTRLVESYPNAPYTAQYADYVRSIDQSLKAQTAQVLVQVGKPAPDIRLSGPDGRTYALSELKGKVVLLDFWAAWCGPCRRENPNVVRIYEKYNAQGFEVFSVSLDREEVKWKQAIEADKLRWPYHVSDLQYWNSEPAQLYGVRSIPQAFLIDRQGNIAQMSELRGAALEEAVKRLL